MQLPALRSRRLRYGLPAVVTAALVGAAPVLKAVTADAKGTLPPRTAAQLLVDVSKAKVTGLSGTVVETTNLGLPALPSLGGDGGNSADFSSLMSGSHTMRVWYAGPERVRLALLGQLGESDLVRNGTDLWAWSSHGNTATHWSVPAHARDGMAGATAGAGSASGLAMTPQQAASAALAAIGPSTRVATDPTAVVAGRRAYELDLVPRDPRSLVGSVRIAIDGASHIPTRVQVFARGASAPALQVGFTSFTIGTPSSSVFGFTPPPGATVKQGASQSHSSPAMPHARTTSAATRVVGKGWTSVLVTRLPGDTSAGSSVPSARGSGGGTTAALLRSLPTVSGSWGSGRLLRSSLVSVVLADDGRVAIGAVPPSLLYRALAGS
jgi:outer membrane lipoprotein-sorting protein